ncbi:MAG: hypothetical protein EZS28_010557 [Streblomastix strix]|uniref:Uncharacterized protein n=1 Tax=Streblomastix strix TaxID=222440 RepID=A0A5J4WFZ5_9EUKA|nr:MAG: hypothetical protein EZS28_010557 [Streblomastix strix]
MSGLRKFGKDPKPNKEQNANSDAYANVDDDDDSDQLEELYDDLLNSRELALIFDGKRGKTFVLEDDEPVAEVRQDGFYDTEGKKLFGGQFGFENIHDETNWLASVTTDITKIQHNRAQSKDAKRQLILNQNSSKSSQQGPIIVPRKRLRIEIPPDLSSINISPRTPAEITILPPTTPNITGLNAIAPVITPTTPQQSFAQQFENEKKRYSKFQSKNDEEIAKGIVQILEGVVGVEMKNFDAQAFTLTPMERQILYDKTRWRGANRICNIPNVTPSTYGEKYTPAKYAVESCTAIQHAILKLLQQVATNDVDNLIEGLVDTYKLALLATGDAQTVRENMVGNTQQRPAKFEVYSATSKKRLGEIKKMQGQDFQISRFSRQYQNNQLGRGNQKTFRRTAIYQKGKGQGQGAPKGKDFKRGWRYNKQQDKSDDEPPNQDGGGGDHI